MNDTQRAVDKVKDLPADSDDPVVEEINMKIMPIIEIAISGDPDEFKLQEYAEGLERLTLNLPEVAKVQRRGWRDKEIWVEVDPAKLKDYYISLEEVILALRSRNLNLPAGTMRGKETEYIIRTSGEFLTKKDVDILCNLFIIN